MAPLPFMRPTLWIEIVYSIIMIATCLIIYFRTREVHKLSQYKGIKYFRLTFLFFAITYLLRSIVSIQKMIFGRLEFRNFGIHGLPQLLIIYTGSIALLYLIQSMAWKHFKEPEKVSGILHLIAVIIALVSFMFGKEGMMLFGLTQIVFFILAAILVIKNHNKTKKRKKGLSQFHIIYTLFFASWIINGIALFVLITMSTIVGWIIYLISILLLALIAIKIIKVTK
jgi:hypothetical protein